MVELQKITVRRDWETWCYEKRAYAIARLRKLGWLISNILRSGPRASLLIWQRKTCRLVSFGRTVANIAGSIINGEKTCTKYVRTCLE